MKRTPISTKEHRLVIENPGVPVPDGHGGYTTTWQRLAPTFWGSLEPASAHDLERVVAHTEQASTVMAIRGLDYHPDVSIDSRVVEPETMSRHIKTCQSWQCSVSKTSKRSTSSLCWSCRKC